MSTAYKCDHCGSYFTKNNFSSFEFKPNISRALNKHDKYSIDIRCSIDSVRSCDICHKCLIKFILRYFITSWLNSPTQIQTSNHTTAYGHLKNEIITTVDKFF